MTLAIAPARPEARSFVSSRSTNSVADRGGVSRPSRKQWIAIGALAATAASIRAKTCSSELCTQPSDSSPMRCSVPPVRRTCANARARVSFSANSPLAIAASMTVTPCGTTRPLPRFVCPTSLLPMMPFGRPTASPDASRMVCG